MKSDLMRPPSKNLEKKLNPPIRFFFYFFNLRDSELWKGIRDFRSHFLADNKRQLPLNLIQKWLSLGRNLTNCTISLFERNFVFLLKGFRFRFRFKKSFKMLKSDFSLCNNHESISILIQPMQQSSSDKIPNAWKPFVMMIEKANNTRLANLPNTVGMRQNSFRLVNNQIISGFPHDRNLNRRRFLKNHRRQISF